jgi:hypothetical protein
MSPVFSLQEELFSSQPIRDTIGFLWENQSRSPNLAFV